MKRLKITTQEPKTIENADFFEIKSVIIKHPKSSHNLSKTIMQVGKVSQVGFGYYINVLIVLYIVKQKKSDNFLNKKCVIITITCF